MSDKEKDPLGNERPVALRDFWAGSNKSTEDRR
jgi:hypothetical protein